MNNIVLIGFMGCGKSSVGLRYAQMQGIEFVDTDQLIVEKQGRSINEIFATDGEKVFRKMETDCLKELLAQKNKSFVLSVGGGVPIREENRKLLKQIGTVIFLKASPNVIFRRLRNDKTRPLLQNENPRGRIMDLMSSRKQFYEAAADYVLDVDGKNFDEILTEIGDIIKAENN